MSLIGFSWRDREPFGPLVARSGRGILHRARLVKGNVVLATRCAAGKPVRAVVLSDAEAVEYVTAPPVPNVAAVDTDTEWGSISKKSSDS